MKFLKIFFDFKVCKYYKVTILFLILIVLVLQTSLSITNKKVRYANIKISSLNDEIKKLESSKVSETNTDILLDIKEENNNDTNIQSLDTETIDRYKAIAKGINKNYDRSIKDGNKIIAFETLDLATITDNQIKAGLYNLTKDNFGIEINIKTIQDENFYKIILIE